MSKGKNLPKVQENQAFAENAMIRGSARKLNLVATLIRGKDVGSALHELTLNRKRVAGDVRKALVSAIANAENNHSLDIDLLMVKEATVGKALVLKRFMPRAKGRAGAIRKPFSKIRIVVEERQKEESA